MPTEGSDLELGPRFSPEHLSHSKSSRFFVVQDESGQIQCKSCPANTITLGVGSLAFVGWNNFLWGARGTVPKAFRREVFLNFSRFILAG